MARTLRYAIAIAVILGVILIPVREDDKPITPAQLGDE